jgi:predicted permease
MTKHPLDDLDADIRDHIERETQDNIERGISAEEARYAALRKFGSVTLAEEETRAVWIPIWLDQLRQDLGYACRSVARAPTFTIIVAASSALGIGACSLVFAILNFAMLQRLPIDEPTRLLRLSGITMTAGNQLSFPVVQDLRAAQSFDGIAAYNPLLAASIGSQDDDPQRHWGALVTADYFSVVRPRFVMGRGFDPRRDDTPGEPAAVVLSYALWQRRFHGNPSIVGRSITINRRPATVIGITDAGFRGTEIGFTSEFWIPFSMIDELESRLGPMTQNRNRYWLEAVGRLKPGIDIERARAELDIVAGAMNARHGESRRFHLERAGQINPGLRNQASALFGLLVGVTVLVLLTSCANVANLLLGRASSRTREMVARAALGASRGRLLRQLLTESVVLASIGGVGGLIVAIYGARTISLLRIPLGWPLDLTFSVDAHVLLFCGVLSIATGVAFGLVPALRATRTGLVTDLKGAPVDRAAGYRVGLRNGLVVTQVAICTILLVSMGLFLRSLQASRDADIGLTNRNLLLMAFDPGIDRQSDVESKELLRNILESAQTVAGVQSATLTSAVPLTLIVSNSNFVAAENAKNPQARRVRTDIYGVGPAFFATMGIPIVSGEEFRFGEASGRSAIINEAFARAAFPDGSPIGRRVVGDGKALDVVGVVGTAKSRTVSEAPRPSIYLPILSEYSASIAPRGVTLVVKTAGNPSTHVAPIREAIRRVDRRLAVFDVRTMESHIDDALILPRVTWAASALSGCAGLALAMIGVYGVVSFAVARRRQEIGIRMAVGATSRDILTMIVRQGIMPALIGMTLGLLIAVSLGRVAANFLYGVPPTDLTTFVTVAFFLVGVALMACWLPARKGARLDPIHVLRTD